MGKLFSDLCKGPVVVIDDRIGKEGDLINRLIENIKNNKLPVLLYKSPDKARDELPGLLFSNFIILDWMFDEGGEPPIGVTRGDEAKALSEKGVIDFIRELKEICLAPIFILSAYDKGRIISKLEDAKLGGEIESYIFVENKDTLCKTPDSLVSKIEDWIKGSSHIYLAKWWTNELLSKNTALFWRLYESNADWPTLFYRSFKGEEDPILALKDILGQLAISEVDVSSLEPSLLEKKLGQQNTKKEIESMKDLYRKLVYTENREAIKEDICPGDIFKKDGKYYLNIRPECDTTKRAIEQGDDAIYLLPGEGRSPEDVKEANPDYKKWGILDKAPEITLQLLDDQSFVVFKKRELSIESHSEWKKYKICRLVAPFTNDVRHRYASFLSRVGLPSYPRGILESLLEPEGNRLKDTKANKGTNKVAPRAGLEPTT